LTSLAHLRGLITNSTTFLDLSSNFLTPSSLCSAVWNLSNLTTLRVSEIGLLGRLPRKCFPPGLEVLDLSANPHLVFSSVIFPSSLRELYLSGNELATVSPNLLAPTNLAVLDLSGSVVKCDCSAMPLAVAVNNSVTVRGVACTDGESNVDQIAQKISSLGCGPVSLNATRDNGPIRSGQTANITCVPNGDSDPPASITWVTHRNVVFHWLAPGNSSVFVSHPGFHLASVEPVENKEDYKRLRVEENGTRLIIENFNRLVSWPMDTEIVVYILVRTFCGNLDFPYFFFL
jgi:hypothetical protein